MHTSSRRIITVPLHLTGGKTLLLSLRRQSRKYILTCIYKYTFDSRCEQVQPNSEKYGQQYAGPEG